MGLVGIAVSSLIVSLGVALAASWKLTAVNLVFIPFLIAAGFAYGKDIKGSAQRNMRTAEQGGKVGDRKSIFSHWLRRFTHTYL